MSAIAPSLVYPNHASPCLTKIADRVWYVAKTIYLFVRAVLLTLLSINLYIISVPFSCMRCSRFSKTLSFYAEHIADKSETLFWGHYYFGKNLIVPSLNRCSKAAKQICIEGKLPKDIPTAFANEISDKNPVSPLNKSQGICMGMTDHFNSLILGKTLKKNNIIEAAKLLEDGATSLAMIIQKYEIPQYTYQDKNGFHFSFFAKKGEKLSKCKNLFEIRKKLDAGVYNISRRPYKDSILLTGHVISYIKISDSLGFIFDANFGLIQLKGSQEKVLATHLDLIKKDNGDIELWLFEKVEKKQNPTFRKPSLSLEVAKNRLFSHKDLKKTYDLAMRVPTKV